MMTQKYKPTVIFSISENDLAAFLEQLQREQEIKAETIKSAGATGGGDVVSVIVQLTPPVLTFVLGMVTAWANRPRASIEIGAVKATGLPSATVERLLISHLASSAPPEKPAPEPK